jgi:hypothetical protein
MNILINIILAVALGVAIYIWLTESHNPDNPTF